VLVFVLSRDYRIFFSGMEERPVGLHQLNDLHCVFSQTLDPIAAGRVRVVSFDKWPQTPAIHLKEV